MATTGFWPVKGRLKEVIDYANNPDKTTAKEYLDEDLYAAIRYVENDDKTDQTLFVSGINCSKHNAYNEMVAIKRRFGERGKNIAYHGYQSFAAGEVTPAEAHAIGMETARKMWGAKYQVVVTTHLNTDNIHNHFVVNSVSFKTGRKFRNGIGDRLELRKISDAICAERNKSVIQGNKFYSNKKAYWVEKSGKLTHRDMLRKDVDEALSQCGSFTMRQQERKRLERVIERGTRRISEIDKLIEAAFERNVLGKLEDDRYERMVKNYAQEQRELIAEVQESKVVLQKAEQQVVDLRLLLRTLRELTEVKELTPTLVNSLIERIEIHNNDKSGGHCYVKVDIYFTAAGMIDIPTEEEILAMMEEIRENPQEFRYVA